MTETESGDSSLELTVEVVSLNEPLPETTFKLVGLDIPVGRSIDRRPSEGREQLYWNGEEVVSKVRPVRVRSVADMQRQRWVLISVSVALGLITFRVMWKYYKNRGRPKTPG